MTDIILQSEVDALKIGNLADRPNAASNYRVGNLSAAELKAAFDASLVFLAGKINSLQDLNDESIAEITAALGDINALSSGITNAGVTTIVAAVNKMWQDLTTAKTNWYTMISQVAALVNNYGNLSTDAQYRSILQRLGIIEAKIGTGTLNTVAQTIIAAINEVKITGGGGGGGGGGGASSEDIEAIEALLGDTELTTTATTITAAIVEIVSRLITVETAANKIGSGTLNTTATTIIAAINEILNGYAPIVNGKIPVSYIPGASSNYVEGYYYNSAFYEDSAHTTAITPTTGTIYVDLGDSNKQYKYTGSAYQPIFSASLPSPTVATDGYLLVGKSDGSYELKAITDFFVNVGTVGQ